MMAPTTRSSVRARSEDERMIHRSGNDIEGIEDEEPFSEFEDDDPSQSSLHEFLQPLQETAERVSEQVESFAKQLHQFNTDRQASDQKLWEDAWGLLDDFYNITSRRAEDSSSRSPRRLKRKYLEDTAFQHDKIALEADLWQLLKNILVCKSPEAVENAKNAQNGELADLHRYSSNANIWNSFLNSDLAAQEYEAVLDWLQTRSAKTDVPITTIVHDLVEKSERGDGVWSAGPMFTKNTVKQRKRNRGLVGPLEPGQTSQRIGSKSDSTVVSQLDPDAESRQGAKLEAQDEFHERAAWIICWELLRRGQPLDEVRSQWSERNEQWRSLVCCCSTAQPGDTSRSPWYRIMNIGNNAEWASQCRKLCKSDLISDTYQRAVYGVLCGDSDSQDEVCEMVDDKLFVAFNSYLIERYVVYYAAYQRKLLDSSRSIFQAGAPEQDRVSQMLRTIESGTLASREMQQPGKAVQMAILECNFDHFLQRVGRAAADVAYSSDDVFRCLMAQNEIQGNLTSAEAATARDPDSTRLVAHLQIVLRSLGLLPAYEQHEYIMENNIANYIGWLQKDKKWNLIPLYASKLSKGRAQKVLGTILIDVSDEKERALLVRLLKKYKMNVADILYGIWALVNWAERERFETTEFRPSAPRITHLKGTGKAAHRALAHDFMGYEPSAEADKSVASVEWYRYIDAPNWGKACYSIAFLYKLWLCQGNLGAVKMLPDRVNLADMSLHALGMNLMFVDEFEEADAGVHVTEHDEDASRQGLSPSKIRRGQQVHPLARSASSRQALYEQSLVWQQLEQLVVALDALNSFQDLADEIDAIAKDNSSQIKTYKNELRKSFDEVQIAMIPLVDKEYLCIATDDMEARQLTWIRNHYLTEAILGYNSVLYFAGHALTRTHLAECMELAQIVASTPSLTQAFVESGRMRELVKAFALDSQSLLLANEQGKKGSAKWEKKLEVWQVQWKDGKTVDLDELD